MTKTMERTEVGTIEMICHYSNRLPVLDINELFWLLNSAARRIPAGREDRVQLIAVDFGEGSFRAKLALAFAAAPGVALAADSAAVMQYVQTLVAATKPTADSDVKAVQNGLCRLTMGDGVDKIEIVTPSNQCLIIDRALAKILETKEIRKFPPIVDMKVEDYPMTGTMRGRIRRIDGEFYMMPDNDLRIIPIFDLRNIRCEWREDVSYDLTGILESERPQYLRFLVKDAMPIT